MTKIALGCCHPLRQPGSTNGDERFDVTGSRLFIPMSLGNHYYTNERLRRLYHDFAKVSDSSLVFLCDHLRYLSYLIRGESNEEEIRNRVAAQVAQMKVTLAHCGFEPSEKLSIQCWEDIASDLRVAKITQKLEDLIRKDADVAKEAAISCEFFLRKFRGSGPTPERAAEIQKQYLVAETALSIYMNECVGFTYEVYRRGAGFVDFLYASKPQEVRFLSGGSANRRLLSLESIWQELPSPL